MTLGGEHGRRAEERWRRRRGLERRLHDGPALRLSALSLRLGVLRADAPDGNEAWRQGLDEFADELAAALQELRDVAAAIYPPLLDEAGLGPALRELVAASGGRARVDADGVRAGTAAEGAAYFATAACLAADRDAPVDVRVRVADGHLVLTLSGVDPALHGVVLDEAVPLGGSVGVTDASAEKTEITARFPCA
ncbi:histidine kinase [Actinomycetospora cinnamomea]|uniref:Histidine kinase n=1 Tax=Actinomycetospora cinnamomea TaxID=663609 RepID=A0A2U1FPR3_9PSEU|nr:histidine kinase [Actinomycetospora cinnamomea]PVZ14183.1 histidine kinase [Actinomycetospora cinnamomea]